VENSIPKIDVDSQFEEPEFNVKEIIWKYLVKWPWIVGGIVLSVTICFFYLKYTPTKFEASSTVLIKDESKGKSIDEISVFEDLGLISNGSKLENEIEILKSRTLMQRVVGDLGLDASYYVEQSPMDVELYSNCPIALNVSPEDTFFFNHSFTFGFKPIDRSSFELSYGEKSKRHYYNALVNIGFAKFYIAKKDSTASIPSEEIRIEVRPTHLVAAELSEKLKVEAVNNKSNVIRIALRDPVQKKAIDVLNSLIKQYREDAIEDKNQLSLNTSEFINERIRFITSELSDVEVVA
jgi:uncharacterized protein involved in exopolysaccharide biosynthesis